MLNLDKGYLDFLRRHTFETPPDYETKKAADVAGFRATARVTHLDGLRDEDAYRHRYGNERYARMERFRDGAVREFENNYDPLWQVRSYARTVGAYLASMGGLDSPEFAVRHGDKAFQARADLLDEFERGLTYLWRNKPPAHWFETQPEYTKLLSVEQENWFLEQTLERFLDASAPFHPLLGEQPDLQRIVPRRWLEGNLPPETPNIDKATFTGVTVREDPAKTERPALDPALASGAGPEEPYAYAGMGM